MLGARDPSLPLEEPAAQSRGRNAWRPVQSSRCYDWGSGGPMGMLVTLPAKSSWKKRCLSPVLKDEAEFSKKGRGRGLCSR